MEVIKLFVLINYVFAGIELAYASDDSRHEASQTELVQLSARQSSRDVKVPRTLVALVEKEYRDYLTQNKLNVDQELLRQFIDIEVEFLQGRTPALNDSALVSTPLGGGVIDLAEMVQERPGSFHVKVRSKTSKGEKLSDVRVFFVNRARNRKMSDGSYGAICGEIYEISNHYNKHMSSDGWTLYSADQRYLSVLGGTFVLVSYTPESILVGSVTFMDSRYPQLMCEENT